MSTPDPAEIERLLGEEASGLTRADARRLASTVTAAHWETHTPQLLAYTERLLHSSRYRDALELLSNADAEDTRARQLRAWALRGSGAPNAAADALAALRAEGATDEETLGLSGSVQKDLGRLADDPDEAASHQQQARELYADAFARYGNYWTGINAATLSLRCGASDEAHRFAREVVDACKSEIGAGGDSYYSWATLAQAQLLLGDDRAAQEAYARAVAMPDASFGKIGRDKREATELLALLDKHLDLTTLLPVPGIAVFAGCRAETAAGEPREVFSEAGEARLRAHFDQFLERGNIAVAYAAAADGSDLVFLEAVLARGGEAHVVLPTDVEGFRAMSVAPQWQDRFDRVIERADTLTIAGDRIDPADAANLDYGNRVILGMARMKARELVTHVSALAVWDRRSRVPGGTGGSVELWQAAGVPVQLLDPNDLDAAPTLAPSAAPAPREAVGVRRIKAMLRADIVGYSRLDEAQVAGYYENILPRVADICERHGTLVQDTFGDAYYFVFDEPHVATVAAFELRDVFNDTDLNIRIALHAGPLLECYDPIRKSQNYTGRHASRAARVEPVADENQILATQQFAALADLGGRDHFEYVYAGERTLPKGFGTERLYVVTRR